MKKVMKERSKIFTPEEVESKCTEYFNGDDLAASVWMSKYAMRNKKGEFLEDSPSSMHRRMAKEFARIEEKHGKCKSNVGLSPYGKTREPLTEESIFKYFNKFKDIIPQGSVMSVLGNTNVVGSLSNCIVIPKLHDSYGGICWADEQLTHLMKRRCGVGLDISTLRPDKHSVSNAAGSSTGAVSFMHRFSNTTNG